MAPITFHQTNRIWFVVYELLVVYSKSTTSLKRMESLQSFRQAIIKFIEKSFGWLWTERILGAQSSFCYPVWW